METLALAMLSNALVATGLALAPIALARSGRSPALVHGLWLVVLLKLVTPPIVQVPLAITSASVPLAVPVAAGRGAPEGPGAAARLDELIPDGLPSLAEAGMDRGEGPAGVEIDRPRTLAAERPPITATVLAGLRWQLGFLVLVGAGAVVCWSLAALRIVRLQRLLGELRPAPADVQSQVYRVARQLGLRRPPTVWLAPGRVPPMLWALGRQVRLLLPADLWPNLDEGERAALLAHELAHLRRKDHWVRWLDLAVAGLYWWHPVIWWARRGVREVEEQCCDAWAVWALPRGSSVYARALMAVLDFVSNASTTGVAAAAAVAAVGSRGHVSSLKRRMRMIAQARTPRGLSWAARLGVLGLAALTLPLAPTWAQKPDAPDPDRGPDPAAAAAKETLQELAKELRKAREELTRQQHEPKAEAEGDDDRPQADNHLENLLKDLGDTLSKDLGPVGVEFLKTLEKATQEVSDALGKEGIISKDLRLALERAGDELSRNLKEGGPLNEQARDAAEKARQDMRKAVERAREDVSQALRDRADTARDSLRSSPDQKPKDDEPAAEADEPARPGDVENARREVRQMEQELRRAMRRLEAIERRAQRQSRTPRRGPDEASPKPAAPPRPPAPPVPPRPPAPPEGRTVPRPPEPPAPPEGLRRSRGPDGRAIGPRGPNPPVLNPRVERRLEDLESKMDRLLKELESLKGEKKEKPSEDSRGSSTS